MRPETAFWLACWHQPNAKRSENRLEEHRALLRSVAHSVTVNPAARRGGDQFDRSRVVIDWKING